MKRKVLFLAIAAFFSIYLSNAQAQSSIHSCVRNNSTMEYIGDMAHPAQTVLDVEYVNGTSSYIDIRIKFKSKMREYWEPYRIILKQHEGVTYAYEIRRTEKVSIWRPFAAIDVATFIASSVAEHLGYSKSDNDEMIRALYGSSERNLTEGQKAAIILMDYCFGD